MSRTMPGCESPSTWSAGLRPGAFVNLAAMMAGRRPALRVELAELPPDHERDEPVMGELFGFAATDHFAIAQDNEVVAQPQHVAERV